MSEEEDDYMSDAILNQCVDVRPGLVSKTASRNIEKERSRTKADTQSKTKPRQVLEAEKRDEGLQKSLNATNKGFALLAKMGYKPGQGIGKEGRKGRTEPVPVEIKDGRRGLGHATERKRLREEAIQMRHEMIKKRQRMHEQHQHDFRNRHRTLQKEKETDRDLGKSQSVCYQLDTKEGINYPVQQFYWSKTVLENLPSPLAEDQNDAEESLDDVILREKGLKSDDRCVEEDEEDEEDYEFTTSEKLQMLTSYLRSTYMYCVWCGTQYDDKEDLNQNCPGDSSADHDD